MNQIYTFTKEVINPKPMTDIQTASTFINSLFTVKTKENGEKYTVFSDTMTQEIEDSLCDLGFEIRDSYYEFGREACTAIAEYLAEHDDELEGKSLESVLEDLDFYELGIEADIYTADLTKWLASSVDYIEYIDRAMTDYEYESGIRLLATAQVMMKHDVFEMISTALIENYNKE